MFFTFCFLHYVFYIVDLPSWPPCKISLIKKSSWFVRGRLSFCSERAKGKQGVTFKLSSQSLLFNLEGSFWVLKFCYLAQITLRVGIKFLNSRSACLSQEFSLMSFLPMKVGLAPFFASSKLFWWMGSVPKSSRHSGFLFQVTRLFLNFQADKTY